MVQLRENPPNRLPEWMKVRMPGRPNYLQLKNLLQDGELHTVCEEARCPNIGECWESGTATFMILGAICTRRCHYCAVTTGRPTGIDVMEPERLAQTVQKLGLKYCVITSVNRDDLVDGGAFIFAKCIQKLRHRVPGCKVEVLIPDFDGSLPGLKKVVDAGPDVLNHNIESTRAIFPKGPAEGQIRPVLEALGQREGVGPCHADQVGHHRGHGRKVG